MIIQAIHKEIKLSKAGKPYASVSLQFDEYKDGTGKHIWINGFGNNDTWKWKVGDDVQPEITQNDKYYNFAFNDSKENALNVYRLPATIGFVMSLLKAKQGYSAPSNHTNQNNASQSQSEPIPDVVEPSEIPF